jgi:hypothetical protein
MTCPIGLPGIDGKEPETIAAAVVAQLLLVSSTAGRRACERTERHAACPCDRHGRLRRSTMAPPPLHARAATARGQAARQLETSRPRSDRRRHARAPRPQWSQRVTETSDALDLKEGVFREADPDRIARSLKASAEHSSRRKSDPYRSAMSMLTFYINRAGAKLPQRQKRHLEAAKDFAAQPVRQAGAAASMRRRDQAASALARAARCAARTPTSSRRRRGATHDRRHPDG